MIERTDFEQWRSKEVARLLALVETERRYYQDMVAALPVPLAVLSDGGALVWANRAFRRVFGLRSEDVRRKEIEQLLPDVGLGELLRETREQGNPSRPINVEASGQPARLTAIPVRNWDEDSEAEVLLILELGAAAATVAEPAQPQVLVPPDLPGIVWTADGESTDFRSVAGAVEEFMGYPMTHWLNRAGFFEERIHPDDRESVMALYRSVLDRGGDGSAEFRAITASGDSFWCRESIRVASVGGTPRSITGVLTNISRRKQFEQQLLSNARLDGLQAMAGRLAHDLNNPLMIINGYGEELVQALGPTNPLRGDASEIMTAAKRISGVAGKLTEFARKPAGAALPVVVSDIVKGLDASLAQVAGERVTIEMTPVAGPITAMAEPVQLAEVILTLASAERESAKDRTRLTVSCGAETVAERLPVSPIASGRYATITLRDDGLGLDAAKIASVFDPNVSAVKPEGFAMSRIYGLVKQWGGDIAAASEPRRGSIFTIFLPLIEAAKPAAPATTALVAAGPEPAPPPPEPMRETVLVVDDEAGIRGLMRKILRRERYNVLEAPTAEDAMQIAAAHEGKIDLLLTDVMLPGMLGPELARKLYALDPKLKVLYISGYTQDESVRTGEYPPGSKFLAKPFTLGALLQKVRETLA